MDEATSTRLAFPEPLDLLTEVLRSGARKLLAQAVEAEVAEWIDSRAGVTVELDAGAGGAFFAGQGRQGERDVGEHVVEVAQLGVFKYIETLYNRERLHQALCYKSPDQFETEYAPVLAA